LQGLQLQENTLLYTSQTSTMLLQQLQSECCYSSTANH
jgi:hypothetical protein